MHIFSNREIAIAIWVLILILFCWSKKEMRSSCKKMIKQFFVWKLTQYYMLSIIYFIFLLILINTFMKTNIGLIKDSIIWFIASGLISTANVFTLRDKHNLFSILILDNLKFTIFVEFIIATYVFPLPFELVIIPLITFIAIMGAFAEVKKEYESVGKITNIVQSIIGLVVLSFSIISAIKDYNNLIGLSSIKSFILPIVLMILYFPFSYLFILYVKYEEIFIRVNTIYKNINKKELGKIIKRRVVIFCGLNYSRVNDIRSNTYYIWHFIENEEQIDELIYYTKNKIKKIFSDGNS